MIFEYYLIFSITTSLCIVWLNILAKIESGVKEITFIFYTISFILSFLFSPVFFLIFVFYADGYKKGIIEAMSKTYE